MGKRILTIMAVFAFTLFASPVFGAVRVYQLYLNPGWIQGESAAFNVDAGTTVSGTTDVILSGPGFDRSKAPKTLPWKEDSGGVWVIQLDSIVVSEDAQAQAGDNSGATFSFWGLPSVGSNFITARKQYLFYNQDLGGTSPYPIAWEPMPGCDYQFRFDASGATLYDRAKFTLITGLPAGVNVSGARVIDETEYVITSATGVSNLVIPDGASEAIVTVKGDDIVWSLDPVTAVESDNGNIMNEGDYWVLDDYNQMGHFSFAVKSGGSGATVYVTTLSK